ncbi:hypothetical protein L1987_11986 [Smallanthus sonchifolius]|uniref:Uncharacterized protein n=1 Tax=Smallanthus sonchifolius TaxID=185202 RepID=A0ACB9JCI8_9ASTR|nr:hypothetical protein L1987_11986 [Smallanthus sonchifolius]
MKGKAKVKFKPPPSPPPPPPSSPSSSRSVKISNHTINNGEFTFTFSLSPSWISASIFQTLTHARALKPHHPHFFLDLQIYGDSYLRISRYKIRKGLQGC